MADNKVLLDHGSGGKISHSMMSDIILPLFNNPALAMLDDGATLDMGKDLTDKKLAFSTDTYVVDPIFFPGGNIGDLAVNGTVNDVAMCGANPLYLSVGLIIEEGLPLSDLETILKTMAEAAKKAGVAIVTGDTKVVPKGKADKIFINTSGVGIIPEKINVSGANAKPGDKIIISGSIADHGITILSSREDLKMSSDIKTDSAALNHMVKAIIDSKNEIHVLRDPTRGGLGTTLNEIAAQSNVAIKIKENALPVKGAVTGMCELLGFDPLYIANEGKLIAFAPSEHAEQILEIIKNQEFGQDACIIGEVLEENSGNEKPGKVYMETLIGGTRLVDMLTGEQLPRIC
jgi:hydrogenase expression/formation protein HypE